LILGFFSNENFQEKRKKKSNQLSSLQREKILQKKQDQSKQENPINQIRKTQQIRTKPTLLVQN
jgi:hypothetical protein